MPTINRLSPIIPSGGLQIPVYSADQGDARRVSLNDLLAWFAENFASPEMAANVYVPSAGFSLAVPTTGANQWMLFQPGGTLATGAITLPLNTQTPDGMEVLITSTQQVTSFTVNLNGATAANGAPTALSANGFYKLRFVQAQNSWYRIG